MFNARESLNLLVDSPALDGLLKEARSHAGKLASPNESAVSTLDHFEKAAGELEVEAGEAGELLASAIQEKVASRQSKVAAVLHMLYVGSRLVG